MAGKSNEKMKIVAVIALAIVVLLLAYYFFLYQQNEFVPVKEISPETFRDLFINAGNVFIVMDVRGISDDKIRRNVLQCGVDFAGSSGMGGKNATYLSIGDDGCIAADGKHPDGFCFAGLDKGVTIYVKEGSITRYYTNGMVVGVGSEYKLGTCGIKRL